MKKIVIGTLAAAVIACFMAPPAFAEDDPPTRVARLSYIQGDVSVQPGDSDDWSWASMNRPLRSGDNVWTQRRGRAEIRIGSTAIRADEETSLSLLNVDDRSIQLGVNSGAVIVHVKNIPDGGYFEIDTPNAAITLDRPGDYRIGADSTGDFTSLAVRSGEAEVDGSDQSFRVDSGTDAEIAGSGRLQYDLYDLPESDSFDRWSRTRDFRTSHARAAQYVSSELTGYEDLDNNGTWVSDPTYGNVWQPTNVATDWTPYRDGHWAWIAPWGWTWLDDQPWGYATSHYGRWAYRSEGNWVWVPPPRETGYGWPVYSPANVVFLSNTPYMNPNGPVISWIPLAPGEVYYPGYHCSHDYLVRLNNPYVHGQWDHDRNHWGDHDHHWNGDWNHRDWSPRAYRNALIAGAVIAVAADIFADSRPVNHSYVRVDQRHLSDRIADVAPVVPVKASTQAAPSGRPATAPKPPRHVMDRRVIAREAPPPRPIPFDRQQRMLEKHGGKPLDVSEEKSLRTDTGAATPEVKTVVAPHEAASAPQGHREHGPPRHNAGASQPDDQQQGATENLSGRDRAQLRQEEMRQEKDQRKADQQQQRDDARQKADEQRQQQEQQHQADQQQREDERQKAEDQRKADQQQRDDARQKADDQRKAEQQQRDEERQKADEQQKADQQQRDEEEAKRRAELKQQQDEARQKAEEQRQAEQQQREEERQKAADERKAQQEQAEQQRQQEAEQRKAEQEQQQQERQQRIDDHRKPHDDQSSGTAEPSPAPAPDATAPQDTQPVRHHGSSSHGKSKHEEPPAEEAAPTTTPATNTTDVPKDSQAPK